MAASGNDKRERLFDHLSKHMQLYEPEKVGIVVCPLCLTAFSRDAVVGPTPELSLAHVIPERLGGTLCTLACTQCNNDGGSGLEAALLDRFRAEDCLVGVGRRSGRLLGSFGNIGVEFAYSPDDNTWSLYAIPKQTNEADIKSLGQYLQAASKDPEGGIRFQLAPHYRHEPGRVRTAIYQSAYLLMFSYFGYEFVAHQNFATLRAQLAEPDKDILPTTFPFLTEESAAAVLGTQNYAVLFHQTPPAIVAILRLCPPGGRERVFAVVLPGLDDLSIPTLGGHEVHQSHIIPYRPDALVKTKHYLQKLWRYVRRQAEPSPS